MKRALPIKAYSWGGAFTGNTLYINPKNNIVIVGLGARPKPTGKNAIDDLDFLAAVVQKLHNQ